MGDRLVRKGLVVGIIVLFIGAGVYPAIAVKLNTSSNTIQDEKSNVNAKKIEQLSDLPCNCEKNNKTDFHEALCDFLGKLFLFLLYEVKSGLAILILFIMVGLWCIPSPWFLLH